MLNDTRIRNARRTSKPRKLTDSAGLYLEVRPTGAKLWRYRYRIEGKENVFVIGEYPEIGLSEARSERDNARKLVKEGIHPRNARKAILAAKIHENKNTFQAVAGEWMEQHKPKWTPAYLRQVDKFISINVFPFIGALPVRSVTSAHLLEIIKRVEKRAPTVAFLIRQWISGIFRYAVATLRADGDPTTALKGAISRPKVEHHKPLETVEIPKLLRKLETYRGYRSTAIALKLLLLTFVRPVELRGAEWSEFDLVACEWRIPAERMKMREPHIVPLSLQAMKLLRELKTINGDNRFLFPNVRRPKAYMSATTLNRAIEYIGFSGKFSAHGFRSTASTVLNEQGYRSDVIERQLAHAPRDKVRASYNQAQYLPERKQMMKDWAKYIDALVAGASVVPIKRKVG